MKSAMQRTLRSRRGQSMAEYAMLLAFVLAFIMMIAGFFKNHMAGTITAGVNNYTNTVATTLGVAVAPYAPDATSSSASSDTANYAGTGAVTSGSNSNSTSSSTSTF